MRLEPKTYRLHSHTVEDIDEIAKRSSITRTDVIEKAVSLLKNTHKHGIQLTFTGDRE